MQTAEAVYSKTGTAIINIIPMFSTPGVVREYRLQPQVQDEHLWSNVDFSGFFGDKHSERYETFPEALEVAKKLVNRVEEGWK